MKTFYWLIKREFWENRGSFLWAPVITAGVFLVLNVLGIVAGEVVTRKRGIVIGGQSLSNIGRHLDAEQMRTVGAALDISMLSVVGIIGVVLGFVVFFYSLGALYDDRRDRSILFWKSLPLSDRDTVLSKFVSATVLAPVIAVIVGVIAGMVMLAIAATTASMHGANLWQLLWTAPHPFRIIFTLIGAIPVQLVWALPTVGWLMLCSAWARSKPFLWAVALPVATGIVVTWFDLMGVFDLQSSWFWRHVVARSLTSVFPGGWLSDSASHLEHVRSPQDLTEILSLGHSYAQLTTPAFYVGAIAGIAMIAAAIWLRRWRTEV